MSPTPGFRRRDTVSPHPAAFKAVARSCGPNPGKHRRRAKMLRGAPALSRDRNTAVAGTIGYYGAYGITALAARMDVYRSTLIDCEESRRAFHTATPSRFSPRRGSFLLVRRKEKPR